MQVFKYLTISLLIGITGIYSNVQSMEDEYDMYGGETVNEQDVKECLKKNEGKTLKEIEENCSKYSFQVLYDTYKKNGTDLVKAVCEICEDKNVDDFLTWGEFIDSVKEKLGSGTSVDETKVKDILRIINKESYAEILSDDLL